MCGMDLVPLRSATSGQIGVAERSHETMIQLDPAQNSAGNVRTSPVEERAVQRKVDLFGEFSYVTDKQIDFTWYYGGRIQKILLDYNTTEIKKGAPLLEVYSDEAIEDQRDCLKMLMELRWHTEAEQKIFDAQYGTNVERVSLVGMSYEHKNMNARLNAMKDRLSRIGMTAGDLELLESTGKIRDTFTIYAPESGTLLGALPHVGSRFTTDTVLFTLVPLNEVWFVFIGKEVDLQRRTLKARFLVPNPNGTLLPQLSATGTLALGDQKPQLAVPASAVIDTGSRQIVYVETSPGTYALRNVKVGPEWVGEGDGFARWVPIIEGLTAGEKVVTSGSFLIDAEAQLRGFPGSGADPLTAKP